MSYSNNRAYFEEIKHMNKSCAVCYSYTDHPRDTSLIKNETKIAVIFISFELLPVIKHHSHTFPAKEWQLEPGLIFGFLQEFASISYYYEYQNP